jgi:hypothetical protein
VLDASEAQRVTGPAVADAITPSADWQHRWLEIDRARHDAARWGASPHAA